MTPDAEFILQEIPEVERIVRDECWLEAERRGCPVDPHDCVIQERVAEIILNGAGEEMRKRRRG